MTTVKPVAYGLYKYTCGHCGMVTNMDLHPNVMDHKKLGCPHCLQDYRPAHYKGDRDYVYSRDN